MVSLPEAEREATESSHQQRLREYFGYRTFDDEARILLEKHLRSPIAQGAWPEDLCFSTPIVQLCTIARMHISVLSSSAIGRTALLESGSTGSGHCRAHRRLHCRRRPRGDVRTDCIALGQICTASSGAGVGGAAWPKPLSAIPISGPAAVGTRPDHGLCAAESLSRTGRGNRRFDARVRGSRERDRSQHE